MRAEPGSWEELVANYDRKAHRKNGWLSLSLTGSFRAIDDRRVARRLVEFKVTKDSTHLEVIQELIDFLESIKEGAIDLDRRIAERQAQLPHERKYLYDDED